MPTYSGGGSRYLQKPPSKPRSRPSPKTHPDAVLAARGALRPGPAPRAAAPKPKPKPKPKPRHVNVAATYYAGQKGPTLASMRPRGKNPTITPGDIANAALSLIGSNTKIVGGYIHHPLRTAGQAIHYKGEFAPAAHKTINGERVPIVADVVPWFGGPKATLGEAGAARGARFFQRAPGRVRRTRAEARAVVESQGARARGEAEAAKPKPKAPKKSHEEVALAQKVKRAETIRGQYNRALDAEAKWAHETYAKGGVQGVKVKYVPGRQLSEADVRARLAGLDKQYEELVKKTIPESSPFLKGEAGKAERQARYKQRAEVEKSRKPGKGKGGQVGRYRGQEKTRTVKQEEFQLAEDALHNAAAAHPNHPGVQKFIALVSEREKYRRLLNERAEASIAGGKVPELPREGGKTVRTPTGEELFPSNPKRNEVVRLGTILEQADREVATARKAAETRAARAAAGPSRGAPGSAQEEMSLEMQEALRTAPATYAEEFGQMSAQRATRLQRAEAHYQRGDYAAGKAELAGAYPQVEWGGMRNFDEQFVEDARQHIMRHPDLTTGEKTRAVDVVEKGATGRVPRPAEQRLLAKAFGFKTAEDITQATGAIHRWPSLIRDALNIPRTLKSALDFSVTLRQLLVAAITHPLIVGKNVTPGIKAAFSQTTFDAISEGILRDPSFALAREAGVPFNTMGPDVLAGAARADPFMSGLAEKIPVIGTIVRGSERAFVTTANLVRLHLFNHFLDLGARAGVDFANEAERAKFLTGVGNFIGDITGQGKMPAALGDHVATVNALFYAPRLVSSRVRTLLAPAVYFRADPVVRREAWKAWLGLGAFAATAIEVAKLAGADVNSNPTNADFGKMRWGNTRVDVFGGHQQYVRFAAQLALRRSTSSQTGITRHFGPGVVDPTAWGTIERFLQGKLSPIPGLAVSVAQGKDFTGQQIKWSELSTYEREVANLISPFILQDIYDAYTTGGPGAAAAITPADIFGVGVQSYRNRPQKPRSPQQPYLGGSTGGSPYIGKSSGGGSPYLP